MSEVTRILSAIEHGDPHAAEQLLPLVYDELRKLAAQRLAHEKPGQTLEATALVHEAYLRLVGDRQFASRPPLLRRGRRGHAPHPDRRRPPQGDRAAWRRSAPGPPRRCSGGQHEPRRAAGPRRGPDALRRQEPAKAELVKLRFFAGLSNPEAAAALGISVATAERWWAFARAWLYADLADAAPGEMPEA